MLLIFQTWNFLFREKWKTFPNIDDLIKICIYYFFVIIILFYISKKLKKFTSFFVASYFDKILIFEIFALLQYILMLLTCKFRIIAQINFEYNCCPFISNYNCELRYLGFGIEWSAPKFRC